MTIAMTKLRNVLIFTFIYSKMYYVTLQNT